MPECPFCMIAAGYGDPPRDLLWEGDRVIIFEPINPVTPGHVLAVPRVHVRNALENPDVTATTYRAAAKFAQIWCPTACNLITSVGVEATQTVFHLHVHIVPRREADGLLLPWGAPHE